MELSYWTLLVINGTLDMSKMEVTMKPLIVFIAAAVMMGCTSTQETANLVPPQLVYQYPLPPYTKPLTVPVFRIALEILVTKEGTVRDVRFLNSSGSREWDIAAADVIKQWKYTPARIEGTPVSIWLHQTAVVKFSEPYFLSLAEIICNTEAEADSAYAMLLAGLSFTEAVQKYSIAASRTQQGTIGKINVQIYPEPIKTKIVKLQEDQFTRPVLYGGHYAIFKRLSE